jgi:IS30 family transposase
LPDWDAQMPRGGSNQMPSSVKKRYFELVREGHMGAAAARRVGVSTSCGSLWVPRCWRGDDL